MDRRIKRTKNSIRHALFNVSASKGMRHVTVQETMHEADINRATFYYHYKDKQDLIEKTIDDLLEGIANGINVSVHRHSFVDIVYPPVLATFEHVQKYHEWYKIILSEKGIVDFPLKMITTIKTSVRSNISLFNEKNGDLTVNHDFFATYFSGELVALLIDWVEKDLPESPSFMARQTATTLSEGVYKGDKV